MRTLLIHLVRVDPITRKKLEDQDDDYIDFHPGQSIEKFYNELVINTEFKGKTGRTLGLAMAVKEEGIELTQL